MLDEDYENKYKHYEKQYGRINNNKFCFINTSPVPDNNDTFILNKKLSKIFSCLCGQWKFNDDLNSLKDKYPEVDYNVKAVKGLYRIHLVSMQIGGTFFANLDNLKYTTKTYYYVAGKENEWSTLGDLVNDINTAFSQPLPILVNYYGTNDSGMIINRNITKEINCGDLSICTNATWINFVGDHCYVENAKIRKFAGKDMLTFGFGS